MRKIMLFVLPLIIAGCGGGSGGSGNGEQNTGNAQPSISGTPPTEIDPGQAYTFTPSASDQDGDSLTFSIKNAPEWASFDEDSGALTGTPSDDDAGSYSSIEISVSDGNGGSASLSEFSITVNPALATISVKQVETTSTALESTSLDLSNYSTVTMLSSNAMDASGQAVTEFAEANKGQALFVSGANDEPIGVAYFSQSQIDSGKTDITVESLADGIIMSNPMLMGYVSGDREAILEQIKTTAAYDTYTDYIESVLSEAPAQLLDEEQYPRVFEDSITLILNAIDTLGGNSAQVLKAAVQPMSRTAMAKSSATTPSPIIGDDEGPYLSDVSGDNILAVNPTMVFYGVEVDGSETQLVAGKEAAFALFDKSAAYPVEEEVFLGNGNFNLSFAKNALNTSGGRLSAGANTLKIACMFADFFLYCPITNSTIAATFESDESAVDIINMWGEDVGVGLPQMAAGEVFTTFADRIVNTHGNQWVGDITRRLYKNADNVDGAVKFFKNGKAVLKVAAKMLKLYSAAQKYIPFAWDFVTSPIQRSWCITQENGVLDTTTSCSYLPPSASFSYSPSSNIYVGDQVSFDASSSTDSIYESTSLEYKWDFDGDGVADTDWSVTDTANHTYSASGIFSALVYVRNPDGLEDIVQKDIEIIEENSSDNGSVGYQEDFSSDPEYATHITSNIAESCELRWDNDSYYAQVSDVSTEWQCVAEGPTFQKVSASEAFRIEFDFNPVTPDWGNYPGIYLVDSSTGFPDSTRQRALSFSISWSDSVYKKFRVVGNDGDDFKSPTIPAENEWYNVVIAKNESTGNINLKITRQDGGVFVDASDLEIGTGDFDQVFIGEVQGGTKYGSFAEIRVDNIKIE